MRISMLLPTLILLAGLTHAASAQTDKQNVLDAAKAIEANTKSREAAQQQERALKWLIETEEVHLIACGGTFSFFTDKKNKNGTAMTGAYMIGMGAFKISDPDKANDENAAQLAGLLLALKAYENGIADNPKTKNDKIEALLQKRSSGELPALVSSFDCGKK